MRTGVGKNLTRRLTGRPTLSMVAAIFEFPNLEWRGRTMKVVNSLKTVKNRHKDCRLVRRRGRVYVINPRNPRFKARQG